MTPEFFDLHKGLPREGPGEPADVLWALRVAATPTDARVLDAGSGPGADTLTLAEALPDAAIEAVEEVCDFADAAADICSGFGDRIIARHGDMYQVSGPYDLIWAAGTVYFRGVTEALGAWTPVLAPGGRISFSEAVWLKPDPPKVLSEFWAGYTAMTDVAGTRERVAAAGFRVLGERILSGAAWEAYYAPIEARIAALRRGSVSQSLSEVLYDAEVEIAMWRQYGDYYGYCLFVTELQ